MTDSSRSAPWLPARGSPIRKGLRGVVVLLLFGVLFYWIPLEQFLDSLRGTHRGLLGLAVVLRLCMFGVSAAKLWLLLPESPEDSVRGGTSFPVVFSVYLTARFFSNFLPTSVGGDLVKVRELTNRDRDWDGAAAAVFTERATGILAVCFLAVLVALPGLNLLEPFGIGFLRYPFLGGTGLVLVLFLWKGTAFFGGLTGALDRENGFPGTRLIHRFFTAMNRYRDRPGTLVNAGTLSVFYHLLRCGYLYVAVRAVGPVLSYVELLPVIPIVTFISLIPVSLGSLGLREGALTFCLTALGTSAPQALAVALLTRFIGYGYSLVGGLLYVLKKPRATSR